MTRVGIADIEWLNSEIRLHGIRENAAALAVMEVPEYRDQTAQTYALPTPADLKPSTTYWPPSPEHAAPSTIRFCGD
jgi:hypothetical protein